MMNRFPSVKIRQPNGKSDFLTELELYALEMFKNALTSAKDQICSFQSSGFSLLFGVFVYVDLPPAVVL